MISGLHPTPYPFSTCVNTCISCWDYCWGLSQVFILHLDIVYHWIGVANGLQIQSPSVAFGDFLSRKKHTLRCKYIMLDQGHSVCSSIISFAVFNVSSFKFSKMLSSTGSEFGTPFLREVPVHNISQSPQVIRLRRPMTKEWQLFHRRLYTSSHTYHYASRAQSSTRRIS